MADKSAEPRIAAPAAVDFDIIWPNDAAAGAPGSRT